MKNQTEIELQKAVHSLLSDPSIIRETSSGKRLQILSPGRLNVYSGPDFKDMAILLNGNIIIGDAEFHKKSNLWFEHKHQLDKNYNNVILHIVLEENSTVKLPFETLILDEITLNSELAKLKVIKEQDIESIQDLQDYALLRILRKTAEAQKILNFSPLNDTLKIIVSKFIEKYSRKSKRPANTIENLKSLILLIENSSILTFLKDIQNNRQIKANQVITKLIQNKILNEGKALRQEIILNCILPLSLALADEINRISLFVWYWSTPAINQYGILRRRFPNIPQNYIWQQQGMLEYINQIDKNKISDIIKNYAFADILDFYRIGIDTKEI